MKTRTITRREMLRLLSKAVKERGEHFVYRKRKRDICRYVWKGDSPVSKRHAAENGFPLPDDETVIPACIVGQALSYLGPEVVEFMAGAQHRKFNLGANELFHRLADAKLHDASGRVLVFDFEAAGPAAYAQAKQDNGISWGEALKSVQDEYGT